MSGSTTWPAGILSPTDPRVAATLQSWVAAADPENHAGALAAVVARVAHATGVDVGLVVDDVAVPADPAVAAVAAERSILRDGGPWLPGLVREQLLSSGDRRRGGVHHTTPAMASTLVDFAASCRPFDSESVVVDPAVGGGVFLLAVCEFLDGDPADRVRQVRGLDLDPLAVATTAAALQLWSGGAPIPAGSLVVADALAEPWPFGPASHVLGNPPFLSQLRDRTGRDTSRRASLVARRPELTGYVDDAAAFLLAGTDAVTAGGVVALVQPSSMLSARDAAPVRARLAHDAPPVGLWVDGGRQFAAAVDTVTLVLQKGIAGGPVQRRRGVPARVEATHPPVTSGSWASLLLTDTPQITAADLARGTTLADVALVTAGFRDQFYGLRGAVAEAVDGDAALGPRLVTSGLIDPLTCRWGTTTCRFDKQQWRRPVVDIDAVDPAIRQWVANRLVPKLVVASQTRVIEAAIDARGDLVPCTPVIAVEPLATAPSLAHLAAALTSPVASLLLLHDAAGSALSADAMRVSAQAIGGLPLPAPGPAWDAAAAAVEAVGDSPSVEELVAIGRLTLAAYGLDDRVDILEWWRRRLPDR
ncbi:MAG: N-6 DNA methylase [Acidimicrobiales bacterium]